MTMLLRLIFRQIEMKQKHDGMFGNKNATEDTLRKSVKRG